MVSSHICENYIGIIACSLDAPGAITIFNHSSTRPYRNRCINSAISSPRYQYSTVFYANIYTILGSRGHIWHVTEEYRSSNIHISDSGTFRILTSKDYATIHDSLKTPGCWSELQHPGVDRRYYAWRLSTKCKDFWSMSIWQHIGWLHWARIGA